MTHLLIILACAIVILLIVIYITYEGNLKLEAKNSQLETSNKALEIAWKDCDMQRIGLKAQLENFNVEQIQRNILSEFLDSEGLSDEYIEQTVTLFLNKRKN